MPNKKGLAVRKYRRQKTMIKKMLEFAEIRGQKVNMIMYDPKMHKIEEVYTHQEFNLVGIQSMIENPREKSNVRTRIRTLKFESYDARLKYKADDEGTEFEKMQSELNETLSEFEPVKKHPKLEQL